MGDNARILYNYAAWDAGTPSPSNSVSGSPSSNALKDPPGQVWDTGSGQDGSQWWKNDLGSAKTISCFGAFAFNWSSAAVVRLQANATDSWGAPSYDQLLTLATDPDGNVYPRLVKLISPAQTFRWWRVTIDDAANPENRLKTGRFIAGQEYELSRNFTRGARISLGDPSTIKHLPGSLEQGQAIAFAKKFRRFTVGFKVVSATEAEKWEAILNKIGNSRPCVLMLDPTNNITKRSAYCYLVVDLELTWDLWTRFNIMSLVFEEKTR